MQDAVLAAVGEANTTALGTAQKVRAMWGGKKLSNTTRPQGRDKLSLTNSKRRERQRRLGATHLGSTSKESGTRSAQSACCSPAHQGQGFERGLHRQGALRHESGTRSWEAKAGGMQALVKGKRVTASVGGPETEESSQTPAAGR